MNSIQWCFLLGLALGLVIAGVGTYKWEEDKILLMETKQQAAVIQSQTNSSKKEHAVATLLNQDGVNYEKQLFALNSVNVDKLRKRSGSKHLPPSSIPSGISRPSNDRLRADTCYKEWYDMATTYNK